MKKVWGLTHRENGEPITRIVTTTKVGIGLPQGKAVHVYIDAQGKWTVTEGKGQNQKRHECANKLEAIKLYREAHKRAPQRGYPERTSYFTFTRVSSDGNYQPDFDAIELHGSLPTEVPIIFFKDDPFDCEYAYFTALEKKCWGNGRDATRVVTLYENKEQEGLALAAQTEGRKVYQITDGCWLHGCSFAQPGPQGEKSACRPHGRLYFQLQKAPRLGATAYYDTTGRRSIGQIFSCLQDFRSFTGSGNPDQGFVAGIPLYLTVRPYRVKYTERGEAKTSTQYGVAVEFRGTGLPPEHLVRAFIGAAEDYRLGAAPLPRQLGAAVPPHDTVCETEEETSEEDEVIIPEIPAALASEFYPNGEAVEEIVGDVVEEPLPEMPQRKAENGDAGPRQGLSAATLQAVQARVTKLTEILNAEGKTMLEIMALIEDTIDKAAGVRSIEHVQEGDAARLIALLDAEMTPRNKKRR